MTNLSFEWSLNIFIVSSNIGTTIQGVAIANSGDILRGSSRLRGSLLPIYCCRRYGGLNKHVYDSGNRTKK